MVYLFIFVGLFLSGVVLWLLREKKKPTNLYLGLLIYFIVLIVFFLYAYSFLNTIVKETVEQDSLSLFRDLIVLARTPAYVFVVLCLIRGIGFNLKQFNFSKDIAELNIADQDSEEFELMVGQNNYKYLRFIRRTIREMKYYILENTVAITLISLGILVILGFFGVKYYKQYIKQLKEQEVTNVNGIVYVLNRAYITAEDINGDTIKEGSKFVVVDMSFSNTSNEDKALNLDVITLANGKLYYHPTQSYNSKFYDLGQPYEKDTLIPKDSMMDAYLVFEIPDTVTSTNFSFRIQYGLDQKKSKIISTYRKIQTRATNIDTEDKKENINTNQSISTDVNNENKFQIKVTDYKIQENYNYKYVLCKKNLECNQYYDLISANKYNTSTMLVLSYEATMFEDAIFTKTFNTYNKVFTNYAFLEYVVEGRVYDERVSLVPQSEIQDKAFVLVNRRILNASRISLIFKFRNTTYIVALKN